MLIKVGLAGSKVRAKAVADDKAVNIQLPQYKYNVIRVYYLIELIMLLKNVLENFIQYMRPYQNRHR